MWLCILMAYIYLSTDKQSQRSKGYGDLYVSHKGTQDMLLSFIHMSHPYILPLSSQETSCFYHRLGITGNFG